jgi:arsenate reductase-like glutaredoxin family protein
MSTYNIKLEDKAAFINRLDKLGVDVESYEIKDDKLKGTFEFTVDDPVVDKIVKTILKQSPKINTIKEMEKITKKQLAEIIREELAAAKKKKMDETQQLNEMDINSLINDPSFLQTIGFLFGGTMIGGALKGLYGEFKKAKTPEEKAKIVSRIKQTVTSER